MNNEPDRPAEPSETTPIMLILAFAPAAMLMATFILGANGMLKNVSDSASRSLLWSGCITSVACCFISSFLLFRRGTASAFFGVILLMFLNGFIAFFFGCCASFQI